MRKLTAIVETAENNLSAYLKEVDGIAVTGNTISDIKDSMKEGIALIIETCTEFGMDIPEEFLSEYEIIYKYDLCSFLNVYSKILNKAGLEQLTGINQKQLWHYASGTSKPRKSTVNKVAASIHTLGRELQNIEFT